MSDGTSVGPSSGGGAVSLASGVERGVFACASEYVPYLQRYDAYLECVLQLSRRGSEGGGGVGGETAVVGVSPPQWCGVSCGGGFSVTRVVGGGAGLAAVCARESSAQCGGVQGAGRSDSFGGEATVSVEELGDSAAGCGVGLGRGVGASVVDGAVEVCASTGRGKWYESNRKKKEKKRVLKKSVPEWRRGARPLVDGSGGCVSDESVTGSVRTVDTRTGIEIEAARTLAACRVAENCKREAEAKVAAKLAEHRLAALQDKDRTVAVQRLAAARYEQKINEAKAKSQASYKKCDESMKSLGSTGSAGEFALKQMVKEARDNAKTLKYVQEQADLFYQYATPEVRRMVAEMPEPEMEDEFEVFGDCPSDYDEEQREAYYDDLNRRNANHGLVGSSPAPPRRELTPEEFLKIEEEIRALSANQV